MLVLTRKVGESIIINHAGTQIKIKVHGVRGQTVRVAVDAPRDCQIDREEIYELKQKAQKNAPPSSSNDT